MQQTRYSIAGQWYKGNTHIHSTASDGGKTFAEIAAMYAGVGYDFLFRTDHWVTSSVATDTESYPLLWMDGIELDGKDESGAYYHVVCLGTTEPLARELGFPAAMAAARAQGSLQILAHPHWCGNTLEDAVRWPFHGVEVYNHICNFLNGKSDGRVHWEAMLRQRPGTLAFASDDAHLNNGEPEWSRGWICVLAPECTREAILASLWAGHYYASTGPDFHSIGIEGRKITVTTSPVVHIRLVGPGWGGLRRSTIPEEPVTEATFDIPDYWDFAYLELEDAAGKRAWSQQLVG